MRSGFSLPEAVLVMAVAVVLLGVGLPRLGGWLDRAAVAAAARETTLAIAVARHRAIAWGGRTRVTIRPDTIVTDTLGPIGWGRWAQVPGAQARGVSLSITNPLVEFVPLGMAWGFSNTRIVLRRGLQSETITVSRVGRVKRW
jgi:Tfp pilus assembly protein FimT